MGFKASNNEVEYEALLAGLRVVEELQFKEFLIHYELMLTLNQVTGDYAIHHPIIGFYLNKAKTLLKKFERYEIMQIPRGEKNHTVTLAGIASNVDYSLRRTIPFE